MFKLRIFGFKPYRNPHNFKIIYFTTCRKVRNFFKKNILETNKLL